MKKHPTNTQRSPLARTLVVQGGGIGLACLIAGLAVLIQDPILYPWRKPLTLALAVVPAMAALLFLFVGYRRLALLLAASFVLSGWQGTAAWRARRDVLGYRAADAVQVERHFVVGYRDLAVVRELVRNGHVGGVFLTRRNVVGRSVADVAAEIAELQAIRREAGLPPLIVAADQEGGPVSHLSPPLPKPPALSALALLAPNEQLPAARRAGFEQGAALRSIGVTMDLAPVVDLIPPTPAGWLDWNTRIGTRAISADPAVVSAVAAGFSEGLLSAGVTPTAKHFPGLGRVVTDTHLFGASLDVAETSLQASDWMPFREVLSIPGVAVMLSHVALDKVDPGVAVSQSRRVVTGILRERWGFSGLAITDDLSMGAIEHSRLCHAVEGALNAGIDLLLVAWDTDKAYPALDCALKALAVGRLDPTMLMQSARRFDNIGGRKDDP
jgi:beta-N-acetylhexosaminidase